MSERANRIVVPEDGALIGDDPADGANRRPLCRGARQCDGHRAGVAVASPIGQATPVPPIPQ